MLCIEIPKSKTDILQQIEAELPECEIITVNSFGSDTMVQVIIPLAAILAPVIVPVLQKAFSDSTITVKYDGIEVSGNSKEVKLMIEEIEAKRKKEGDKCDAE